MPNTPRKPGRPRKASPVVESTPVVKQPVTAQEQAPQAQYTVAKLTAHMLAGEIQRLHQEGEDLSPVHLVSDAIRAAAEPVAEPAKESTETVKNVAPEKVAELKAAVEAAKTSADRPRTFAVAFHNKRGALKLAHGVEYEDGDIDIHNGYGFGATYAGTIEELHETATKRHGNGYHVDYTD